MLFSWNSGPLASVDYGDWTQSTGQRHCASFLVFIIFFVCFPFFPQNVFLVIVAGGGKESMFLTIRAILKDILVMVD